MSVAGDLERAGISIQDRFVSAAAAGDLRECAILRETRGDFAAARIGGGGTEQRLERIRGDFTCWLQQPLLPPESALLEQMEASGVVGPLQSNGAREVLAPAPPAG